MAFTTNALTWEADSTQSTVITGAIAAQADANFSVNGTNATLTEWDNSTLLAKMVKLVATINYASAPTDGGIIEVWAVDTDVDIGGSTTVATPTTTLQQGAKRVGTISVSNVITEQHCTGFANVTGFNKCKFVVYNDTGYELPTGWTLQVKAIADLPAA